MSSVWTPTDNRDPNDVVTAANWNTYLGETGNLQYLYDRFVTKYKTSTQVFTTDTTMADINASTGTFSFPIGASEVWLVDYWMEVAFGGTGGVKFQITGPAAPTAVYITGKHTVQVADTGTNRNLAHIPFTAGTAFSAAFADVASSAALGSTGQYLQGAVTLVEARARIINGANAGTVTLQAAQNNANSTTTLGLGSLMRAERIA